jgi:HlyD family secretion protein
MSSTKKRFLIGGSVLLLLVLMASIFGGGHDLPQVETEAAENRDIVERVTASGKIQPEVEVKITAEVNGQILKLPVKEGDVVAPGDLLVQINPDLYEAALNRAYASLNTAKANRSSALAGKMQAAAQFEAAELSWARSQQLFTGLILSAAEFETAKASFSGAESSLASSEASFESSQYAIRSAEASLQEAQDNLSRTTLRAPQAGIVTALVKEVGESVQGNGFTAGEVIMKVSDLSAMEVNVEVNESDIVRVNQGDGAEIEVDAYLNDIFNGSVTEIGNTALNAGANGFSMDQVTNFSVKIRILSESYAALAEGHDEGYSPFRPGMSATVDILTKQATGVISIPIQAVTTRPDSTEEEVIGVFVLEDGKAQWRPVDTGIQDNRYIEIQSGLSSDEMVIIGPYDRVSRKLDSGDGVAGSEHGEPEEETED